MVQGDIDILPTILIYGGNELLNLLVRCRRRVPVQEQCLTVEMDGREVDQKGHVTFGKGYPCAQGFQGTPSREIGLVIAEDGKMGVLAGQGLPQVSRMIQTV